MKIILDPQIFIYQKFGGISRYYTELYRILENKKDVEITCPIVFTENLHLKEYSLLKNGWAKVITILSKLSYTISERIKAKLRWESFSKTKYLLKTQNYDLFVPTYYDPYFLNSLGSKPFVLTVYDMINEILPQYFIEDKDTVSQKKLLMEKATKIIAISESTRQDIIKIYPHLDATKIEVVYLGFTIKSNSKELLSLPLPKNYILFIGNRMGYKNFIFLLKAITSTLKNNSELQLICAGGNAFTQAESDLISELGLSNKVKQFNFKDNELATYYRGAQCFVFPSEYEGFGIPVLESMACGCPVVLANHSSFPEVAGDAGVYFELNNEIDLREKIEKLLYDQPLRAHYISKGLNQAKKFSWEICVENIFRVFKSVA